MAILDPAARDDALAALPGWQYDGEARAIRRGFRFRGFAEAFGFMTRVALAAEKADHHPDWSNSWDRVEISLSTHRAGGVTERDCRLAATIDAIAASLAEPGPGD